MPSQLTNSIACTLILVTKKKRKKKIFLFEPSILNLRHRKRNWNFKLRIWKWELEVGIWYLELEVHREIRKVGLGRVSETERVRDNIFSIQEDLAYIAAPSRILLGRLTFTVYTLWSLHEPKKGPHVWFVPDLLVFFL